jgi:hypothetical protein
MGGTRGQRGRGERAHTAERGERSRFLVLSLGSTVNSHHTAHTTKKNFVCEQQRDDERRTRSTKNIVL